MLLVKLLLRKVRDSNPRYPKGVYRISSPARSFTLPTFLFKRAPSSELEWPGTKEVILMKMNFPVLRMQRYDYFPNPPNVFWKNFIQPEYDRRQGCQHSVAHGLPAGRTAAACRQRSQRPAVAAACRHRVATGSQ